MNVLNRIKDYFIDKLADLLLSNKVYSILRPLTRIVYAFYERYLLKQILSKPMPKHIAIIPDGNRRWAQSHGIDPSDGHEYGYKKMKDVLQWIYDLGIDIVTIYAMSYENCTRRSDKEKRRLFDIIKRGFVELDKEKILEKYGVRFKVFGKLDIVDSDIVEYAKILEEKTLNYSNKFLNIALCYGGRQEILEAIKSIVKDVLEGRLGLDELSEDTLTKKLSTSHLPLPEPDLVIRTSGELRISNFLLWQIAYSELYFCDVYWPDFRKIDLYRAIRSYQSRERRFGK